MLSTNLIVCEDIRAEAGGKKSLMGVFGAEIVCPALPFQFSKLCFRVAFVTPKAQPIKSLDLEIVVLDESPIKLSCPTEKLREMEEGSKKHSDRTHLEYILEIIAAQIILKQEGPIRVSGRVNNRKVRVGTIWIKTEEAESIQPTAAKPKTKPKAAKKSQKKRTRKARSGKS